jgi:hypothetical protein
MGQPPARVPERLTADPSVLRPWAEGMAVALAPIKNVQAGDASDFSIE